MRHACRSERIVPYALESMPARALLIANPHGGASGRRFARVTDRLGRVFDEDFETEFTRGPRDAARIAREAVRAGVERIMVAGGDGTTSEVVTGLLAAGLGEEVEIALLPMGSGCDFARSLGLPRDPLSCVDLLAAGERRRVDAGRITYRDRSGVSRTSYFLNEASFGVSGLTVRLVSEAAKRFGPRLAFALGTLGAIRRFRPPEVRVLVDDTPVHEGPISLVTASNGRYFGSGMEVAPPARVDDGELDCVVIDRMSKPRLVARFPSIYSGRHVELPEAAHHRARRIVAELASGEALVDVDGEAIGVLPIEIEIRPGAIGLFGQPPKDA